jgi:hypothetical protein
MGEIFLENVFTHVLYYTCMSYIVPTNVSTIAGLFRWHVAPRGVAAGDRQAAGERSVAEQETTRREIIQKAVYVAPAIFTLVAVPTFASAGSGATSPQRGEQLRLLLERLQERRP